MSLWVLDTDHISLFQRGHPLVKKRLNQTKSEEIATTIVTVEEQMRGWLNVIRRASGSDTLMLAYQGLSDAIKYFKNTKILDFDQAAYNCYQELIQQRIRIGSQDLRIASIVISVEGILVTRNRRDFERVPGLTIEDWTIDEGKSQP
ncbi:nucleic acid-binding protein [Moorena producens PAL-8-15-08-1]|uniref:Nucleic acid-binding protein n=1 Tax=Moorena producens PAL-8-15-08-1 TaxID=1458985 RepID=A0A1D8TRQ9_9CYAN|nr:type II toxin-antitoxin system VapC family toxin [Moorena producens]AOX00319.1 nucleic acid-binding protein [Moorena producens PAL-8-15-08-1]